MRQSGIIMPISALPSPYGIGTFGKAAYGFCDFLHQAGQRLWQVLPIGPTSYGDSPYQSFSTYAGNPYFIDLDLLVERGLLTREECAASDWGDDLEKVDYAKLYRGRFPVLTLAWERYRTGDTAPLDAFRAEHASWLEDYALFMSLKERYAGRGWQEWPETYRRRERRAIAAARRSLEGRISFYAFLQFLFFDQWCALKSYANRLGIRIIGDLPIYVAPDSVDVWANPNLFDLDASLNLASLAGCPPDAFTEAGQLWGNPIYRWDAIEQAGFRWWIDRLRAAATLFDIVRLDHFIGFQDFYVIPAGSTDAKIGAWQPGPGIRFFRAAAEALGPLSLIAEDLGQVSPQARALLREVGYPGMKMLEFAFGGDDSEYLPHNYTNHCIVYAGTHDNLPIRGWYAALDPREQARCLDYMGLSPSQDILWPMLRLMQASVADSAVMQMQDVLGLGAEARTNTPGTLGENWCWRMTAGSASDELASKIRSLCALYGRV